MMTSILLLFALLGDDAAANEALEKFKTDYKAKEATARAKAVDELAKTQHDKIQARLGQILTVDDGEVRIAAAKGLGDATENRKKAVTYLVGAIPPNTREPAVVAAILESLGKLKEGPALAEIEKHLKSKNLQVGKAAVEAVGVIQSRTSVPVLIDLLKWLEEGAKEGPNLRGKGYGGGGVPGLGGGGVVDQDAQERDRTLRPMVNKLLVSITKVNHATAKEWEGWWRENGGKFLKPEK